MKYIRMIILDKKQRKINRRKTSQKIKVDTGCALNSVFTDNIFSGTVVDCVCNTRTKKTNRVKVDLLNKKDYSFAVSINGVSEWKLAEVVKAAKKANLKVENFDYAQVGDNLIFGKSDKYDVVLVDELTDFLLGTEPQYYLVDDFFTVLDAIKQFGDKKKQLFNKVGKTLKQTTLRDLNSTKKSSRKTSKGVKKSDIVVASDWICYNNQFIDRNSGQDVIIETKDNTYLTPGLYTEIVTL